MASNPCCPTDRPGVVSDYTPRGEMVNLGDLNAYHISAPNAKAGVVVVYDIFGLSPQAKQVCDRLADAGFNVCMPDFCQKSSTGKEWPLDLSIPENRDTFMAWVGTISWDGVCRAGVDEAVQYLRSQGCHKLGIVGFCWGAKMALMAAQSGTFQAAASAHPSFLDPENQKKTQCPWLHLPSKDDDGTMTGIREALDSTPYGADSIIHKFPTMHHGFACARGDWADAEQRAAATQALGLFVDFFGKHLL